METVMKAGASVAHHHGVGQSKAAYTNHDHPGGHALFEALKTTFDPDGIMNPGKVYLKNAISH
jgi:FAD/FMN-containing dehydrogenase